MNKWEKLKSIVADRINNDEEMNIHELRHLMIKLEAEEKKAKS